MFCFNSTFSIQNICFEDREIPLLHSEIHEQVQALYMDHCFLCAFPLTVHLAGVTCYILPWVSSTRFNVSLFASHHSAESTAACFHYPLQQPQPLPSHTLSAWLTQSVFDSSVHKGLQVLVPRKKKKEEKQQNNVCCVQTSSAVSAEQLLLFSSIVRAEMPSVLWAGDSTGTFKEGTGWQKGTRADQTCLNYKTFSIASYFSELCRGHKAAEKQHLDLCWDLSAAVIRRVKSSNFPE